MGKRSNIPLPDRNAGRRLFLQWLGFDSGKDRDAKPDAPKPPVKTADHSDETVKETLETIVIAFILAFVFRAFVVEAFVIPTGSMAPTLLGEHVKIDCVECGYSFDMDLRKDRSSAPVFKYGGVVHARAGLTEHANAPCPMCFYPNQLPSQMLISGGDRILVHKYIYSVPSLGPRRWDVVVFKAPHSPKDNYIKRLVGLPNESIQIIEGNVFVTSLKNGEQGEPRRNNSGWRIARKTDPDENPHAETIQRTVWQPVYHSRYVPLDATQPDLTKRTSEQYRWQVPWKPNGDSNGNWEGLEAANPKRSYRYAGTQRGVITFNFDLFMSRGAGLHPYNVRKNPAHSPRGQRHRMVQRLEDLRIAADFIPEGDGLGVQLSTQARIQREGEDKLELSTLAGRVGSDGKAQIGWIRGASNEFVALGDEADTVPPLTSGQTRNVELWYVDQELSLWIDGTRVCRYRFDPDIKLVKAARPLGDPPLVQIAVEGCPVTLHHVQVDRDLYYTVPESLSYPVRRTGEIGRGVIDKYFANGSDSPAGLPFEIYGDQFFCMGDNSPESMDGRSWPPTRSWVRFRKFSNEDDNHFDLNPPVKDGVVPRRMMMGRAFFVYFPAMHGRDRTKGKFIPNFGDMRFIH